MTKMTRRLYLRPFALLCIGVCAVLLSIIVFWVYEWRVRVNIGDVMAPDELPTFPKLVAALAPRGPLHYNLRVGYKDYLLVVSGHMDPKMLPQGPGLLAGGPLTNPEGVATRLGRLEDNGIIRGFENGLAAIWRAPEGDISLYFRPSDAAFTLTVQGNEAQRIQFFPRR